MIGVFQQHIPSFVSGSNYAVRTFTSTEELLGLPEVKMWKQEPMAGAEFHQFSMNAHRLMAEFNGGRKWYVVGFVDEVSIPSIDLPKWEPVSDESPGSESPQG